MKGKPASIGAMIMLGGGLLVYWALSQWKLFGLGQTNESQSTSTIGTRPPNKATPGFGGGSSRGGGGGGSSF